MKNQIFYDVTLFTEFDIYLFKEGTHAKLYNHLGSHFMQRDGKDGVYFAVWAPNANALHVRADFNDYSTTSHPLKNRDDGSGIWEGFIEGVDEGVTYKYHITSDALHVSSDKADPYAFFAEIAPSSASRVCNLDGYIWGDIEWMKTRQKHNSHKAPVSIYEVHRGSWR
jgi:1,4-alpha-glucan branching enzyme